MDSSTRVTVVGTAVGPLVLSVGFEITESYHGVLSRILFVPAAIAAWNLLVPGLAAAPDESSRPRSPALDG